MYETLLKKDPLFFKSWDRAYWAISCHRLEQFGQGRQVTLNVVEQLQIYDKRDVLV